MDKYTYPMIMIIPHPLKFAAHVRRAEHKRDIGAALTASRLKEYFPDGSRVGVFLSRLQRVEHPTFAQVVGTSGDGVVTVQLESINRRGYRTVKRVHWTSVFKVQ